MSFMYMHYPDSTYLLGILHRQDTMMQPVVLQASVCSSSDQYNCFGYCVVDVCKEMKQRLNSENGSCSLPCCVQGSQGL
jgi:hypothetical protein